MVAPALGPSSGRREGSDVTLDTRDGTASSVEWWSYGEWAKRLASHFFRHEYANEHVLFYVDGDALAEIRALTSSPLPQHSFK